MPLLRIKIHGQGEETHAVFSARVTIGRRPDNTIQILDPSVSAYHAELVEMNGHYQLRDLQSTNLCFVEGRPVTDYHLRERCRVAFGSVECEFDPSPKVGERGLPLSPAQMEQDIAFLQSENAELRERNRALERSIDILSSAQLFGKKRDSGSLFASDGALKVLTAERDELRQRLEALEAELEHTREELAIALRARDAAREAAGMLQAEKTTMLREIRGSGIQRRPVPVK